MKEGLGLIFVGLAVVILGVSQIGNVVVDKALNKRIEQLEYDVRKLERQLKENHDG